MARKVYSSSQVRFGAIGAVSRSNAEHYRWGNDCDAWHLVKDKELTVIEELMPAGSAGNSPSSPESTKQFFYILSGEVLMEVQELTTLVPAGSGIRVLPGTRHQIRNPSRARSSCW